MTPDTARLFLGLELNDEARDALTGVRRALQQAGVQGNLYPAALYHLTLVFLGSTPRASIPRIAALMDSLDAEPFSLTLCGTGSFKDSILWAGVASSADLMAYQAALHQALLHAGLAGSNGAAGADSTDSAASEQEIYRPHITLGRRVKFPVPTVHVPAVRFPVRHATLFESTRVNGELAYVPLYRSVFP